MNARKRIKAILNHEQVDKVGVAFNPPHKTDILPTAAFLLEKPKHLNKEYFSWGQHKELLDKVGGFNGEVKYDKFGNILGRLNGLTKGECIKGALEDWDNIDTFELPKFKMIVPRINYKLCPKFVYVYSPYAVFSVLRDLRLMENALMDVLLEPENVEKLLQKILERNLAIIEEIKDKHIDGFMMADDWGIQDSTFVSPTVFRELFKPIYKAMADKCHEYGMYLMVHSCGYNYGFMEDFIDAGIDVLQFDQLGAYGYERMANEFGHRVTFWSPLDIQKTLPTGDKELIESEALLMINAFKKVGGGLILKDYPTYHDIGVKQEWATWARKVFMKNIKY